MFITASKKIECYVRISLKSARSIRRTRHIFILHIFFHMFDKEYTPIITVDIDDIKEKVFISGKEDRNDLGDIINEC